ncbi:MAG: translation initiation factor IF-2 [candidate division Zixibacteria bacterium]|nr:translation initiation factor IF-2 [candidate division Zixibacteria bacterium]
MAKKRIYEVAKEYKISSTALLKILVELKFAPKSHMSVATDEMLQAIGKKFEAEKEAVKKDITQKKKKAVTPPSSQPKGTAEADKAGDKTKLKDRMQKLSGALKRSEKKKKRQERRRKSKEARQVDHKAVVKSFKATMATLGGGKKGRKYKKRRPGEEIVAVEEGVIEVNEFMTVAELARVMDMKPAELIATCFKLGMMASINQRLDMDTIETLSLECGFTTRIKEEIGEEALQTEEETRMIKRAPVVTVMGHVDHGKTSLLDYIRKTNVVDEEAGAITQHIGAYEVWTPNSSITFIDTPGHEAFTAMRARGAQVTDLVVLVVAADDGVMPQTVEAIDHARAAGVPIVVAINKVDKPTANPDQIKQQLTKYNLVSEEWGGKTVMVEVSAKTGQGIDTLLEMIALQSELLDLKADPDIRGQGIVIEARLEKGRGPVSTVIIQRGSVAVGDPIVAGSYFGHVRLMWSDREYELATAGPAMPVRITGLNGVPQAGDTFMVMRDDQEAREISIKRTQIKREQEIRRGFGRATLEKIYEQIKDGQVKELRLVIKADVDGSAEVLSETLGKIATEEVRTLVIHKGVGGISESDVLLAAASDAIIIGFNVRPDGRARELAARETVDIRLYNVIYEVESDVRKALEGMLSPEVKEEYAGVAEVRQVFRVPKIGTIAGCFVKEGAIHRSDKVHVVRDGRIVYTGNLHSLKRFKDDAREVASGYECGIGIEDFQDIKVGDTIEVFKLVETARKLE